MMQWGTQGPRSAPSFAKKEKPAREEAALKFFCGFFPPSRPPPRLGTSSKVAAGNRLPSLGGLPPADDRAAPRRRASPFSLYSPPPPPRPPPQPSSARTQKSCKSSPPFRLPGAAAAAAAALRLCSLPPPATHPRAPCKGAALSKQGAPGRSRSRAALLPAAARPLPASSGASPSWPALFLSAAGASERGALLVVLLLPDSRGAAQVWSPGKVTLPAACHSRAPGQAAWALAAPPGRKVACKARRGTELLPLPPKLNSAKTILTAPQTSAGGSPAGWCRSRTLLVVVVPPRLGRPPSPARLRCLLGSADSLASLQGSASPAPCRRSSPPTSPPPARPRTQPQPARWPRRPPRKHCRPALGGLRRLLGWHRGRGRHAGIGAV